MRCLLVIVLILLFPMALDAHLQIKQVQVNHLPISNIQNIVLLPKSSIEVELMPSADSSLRYQYFLEGYDASAWQSVHPVVCYTNLPGGTYQLIIKAKTKETYSNVITLPIVVENSVFEVWWFWPSVVFYAMILLGAAGYFFILYNFRQKLKVAHIRQRIAADLHDEIGATLSSIAIAAHLIEKKMAHPTPDLLSILGQIKVNSRETIQTIRDTVWTLNPSNDSLPQLVEKMRSFAYQILTSKDIVLEFDDHIANLQTTKITMDQRRNVYLIFKEAINNIAKHSEATTATVYLEVQKDGFFIRITDNGKGFDKTTNYEGNGLGNFKKRADESFINLNIDSVLGRGTTITLEVPEI
jgi:signal transduction histidine kinase